MTLKQRLESVLPTTMVLGHVAGVLYEHEPVLLAKVLIPTGVALLHVNEERNRESAAKIRTALVTRLQARGMKDAAELLTRQACSLLFSDLRKAMEVYHEIRISIPIEIYYAGYAGCQAESMILKHIFGLSAAQFKSEHQRKYKALMNKRPMHLDTGRLRKHL